jgi:hypothetical protein
LAEHRQWRQRTVNREDDLPAPLIGGEATADLDFVRRTSSSSPLELLMTGRKRGEIPSRFGEDCSTSPGPAMKGMAYHGGSFRVCAIFRWRQSLARFSFAC